MRPDDPLLLNRFDDPPMTLRGVVGGTVLLIGLALTARHAGAVGATLRFVIENLAAMTPGAAMGFLIAGGIVSLYASLAVFALVRTPVFLLYLALALTLSLAGALAFEIAAG